MDLISFFFFCFLLHNIIHDNANRSILSSTRVRYFIGFIIEFYCAKSNLLATLPFRYTEWTMERFPKTFFFFETDIIYLCGVQNKDMTQCNVRVISTWRLLCIGDNWHACQFGLILFSFELTQDFCSSSRTLLWWYGNHTTTSVRCRKTTLWFSTI